jgi:hypothetical protein
MNASKIRKPRTCYSCGDTRWGTAQDLKDHSSLCQRAKDVGLILPGIQLANGGGLVQP